MKRNLTCIICPVGCSLTADIEDGRVISITGNSCPRGAKYAETECTNPVRTLTTTVLCENGLPVSVKTNRPIPKNKIFECMKIINSKTIPLPVASGDVIIENIAGCNSDIVATQNMN